MKEIWRDVPVKPFNKNYQVSNLGRVKSKTHTVMQLHANGTLAPNTYHGRVLKQEVFKGTKKHPNPKNLYAHRVRLCINNSTKKFSVHRLVAKAFLPNPHHYPLINHKDRDEQHNWVSNLEWCSYSYNSTYAGAMKRTADHESKPCALIKGNIEYDFLSIPQAALWVYQKNKSHICHNIDHEISRVCGLNNRNIVYGFHAKSLE